MYNVMRSFNLFWIVFCAAMIEMTLNDNNMLQTLAKHSNVSAPAQLLPLLVGTLSFARTVWLIFYEHGNEILQAVRTETAGMEPRTRAEKFRLGFHLSIQRFISPTSGGNVGRPREASVQTHTAFTLRPWHQRYLVAYLPWLSIFGFWQKVVDEDQGLPTSVTREPTNESENEKPERQVLVQRESFS